MRTVIPAIPILIISSLLIQGCINARISVESPDVVLTFAADDITDAAPSTRTSLTSDGKFRWSAHDTIGIYPNTGAQIYYALSSGAECSTADFDGGGWDFKDASTYYSYYPFIGDIYLDRTRIPVTFLGQEQNGITNQDHFAKYDYMYADAARASGHNIHFQFHHLVCILRLYATLPLGTYTKLTVKAPQPVFVEEGYYDLTATTPAIVPLKSSKSITLDLKNVTITNSTVCEMYVICAPMDLSNSQIAFVVTDSEGDELQSVFNVSSAYVASKRYAFRPSTWSRIPHSGTMPIDDWTGGVDITIP